MDLIDGNKIAASIVAELKTEVTAIAGRKPCLALVRIGGYRPEILLVQFGTDGHADDRFSHLELSDDAYIAVAERAHALAHDVCGGALVLLGGGGYVPETVARVWTSALGTIGGFRMLGRDG